MTRPAQATLDALVAARAVAVVRARDAEEAVHIGMALHAGGLGAVELTFTTPNLERAVEELRRRLGDELVLGAGTVVTPDQARRAVEAGADFLVSPHLDLELLAAEMATGLLSIPGVFTPSEAALAVGAGTPLVKLFPASTGGLRHLQALRGPFPELRVIATGGIAIDETRAWLDAGAAAVGLGGELVPRALCDARAWRSIERNAARLVTRLHGAGV